MRPCRRIRVNKQQQLLIVETMEAYPELINGKISATFTAAERARLWTELACRLNRQGRAQKDEVGKWQKSWSDYKSEVKKKYRAFREGQSKTARGLRTELSQLEQRVAALLEPDEFRLQVPESYHLPTEVQEVKQEFVEILVPVSVVPGPTSSISIPTLSTTPAPQSPSTSLSNEPHVHNPSHSICPPSTDSQSIRIVNSTPVTSTPVELTPISSTSGTTQTPPATRRRKARKMVLNQENARKLIEAHNNQAAALNAMAQTMQSLADSQKEHQERVIDVKNQKLECLQMQTNALITLAKHFCK